MRPRLAVVLLFVLASQVSLAQSRLVEASLESQIVPSPVEYLVLLPPGYDEGRDFPLVLSLHGGGGSRDVLRRQKPGFDQMWAGGSVRPMVIVTPSVTARGFYMDRRDGSELWETFLMKELLPHLRATLKVAADREHTFVTGISMGGMGSLRLAFKYPHDFAAVAGMEPGIEPVLFWSQIRPKNRFWRSDALLEAAYGSPIDEEFWAANNPATIAAMNATEIRDSGLRIFIEDGDQDMFWLYEGTRFLHDVLWNNRIRHEFHLYLGEDHVGHSLARRTQAAFEFLSRSLDPPVDDPVIDAARRRIDPLKAGLDEADHYGVDADKIRQRP